MFEKVLAMFRFEISENRLKSGSSFFFFENFRSNVGFVRTVRARD